MALSQGRPLSIEAKRHSRNNERARLVGSGEVACLAGARHSTASPDAFFGYFLGGTRKYRRRQAPEATAMKETTERYRRRITIIAINGPSRTPVPTRREQAPALRYPKMIFHKQPDQSEFAQEKIPCRQARDFCYSSEVSSTGSSVFFFFFSFSGRGPRAFTYSFSLGWGTKACHSRMPTATKQVQAATSWLIRIEPM